MRSGSERVARLERLAPSDPFALLELAREYRRRDHKNLLLFLCTHVPKNASKDFLTFALDVLTTHLEDTELSSPLSWALSDVDNAQALRWVYGYAAYHKDFKLGLKILRKLLKSEHRQTLLQDCIRSYRTMEDELVAEMAEQISAETDAEILADLMRSSGAGVTAPSFLEHGLVFAPYMPLQVTPPIPLQDLATPRRLRATWTLETIAGWRLLVAVADSGPLLIHEGLEREFGDYTGLLGNRILKRVPRHVYAIADLGLGEEDEELLALGPDPPFPYLPKCLKCLDEVTCPTCGGDRWIASWDDIRGLEVREMCSTCWGSETCECAGDHDRVVHSLGGP